MGKATIKADLGKGRYRIQKDPERAAYDARTGKIEAEITALQNTKFAKQDEIDAAKAEIVFLQGRADFFHTENSSLEAENYPQLSQVLQLGA